MAEDTNTGRTKLEQWHYQRGYDEAIAASLESDWLTASRYSVTTGEIDGRDDHYSAGVLDAARELRDGGYPYAPIQRDWAREFLGGR